MSRMRICVSNECVGYLKSYLTNDQKQMQLHDRRENDYGG
jgi:hypothetical protein